jgi:hypothetical protein
MHDSVHMERDVVHLISNRSMTLISRHRHVGAIAVGLGPWVPLQYQLHLDSIAASSIKYYKRHYQARIDTSDHGVPPPRQILPAARSYTATYMYDA